VIAVSKLGITSSSISPSVAFDSSSYEYEIVVSLPSTIISPYTPRFDTHSFLVGADDGRAEGAFDASLVGASVGVEVGEAE